MEGAGGGFGVRRALGGQGAAAPPGSSGGSNAGEQAAPHIHPNKFCPPGKGCRAMPFGVTPLVSPPLGQGEALLRTLVRTGAGGFSPIPSKEMKFSPRPNCSSSFTSRLLLLLSRSLGHFAGNLGPGYPRCELPGTGEPFGGSPFPHHSKRDLEAAFNFAMRSPRLLCGRGKNGFYFMTC